MHVYMYMYIYIDNAYIHINQINTLIDQNEEILSSFLIKAKTKPWKQLRECYIILKQWPKQFVSGYWYTYLCFLVAAKNNS